MGSRILPRTLPPVPAYAITDLSIQQNTVTFDLHPLDAKGGIPQMNHTVNQDYVRHMQGLIQIPTVSSDNDEHTDFETFSRLHKYLEKTWPQIHSRMTKEIIGRASLLFHWKSPCSGRPPVLLMAHQDVVPAGDPAQWTHAPFSADIADGCIWGRGTTDCKCVMLSELEAVESLFTEGFAPDYDIYLAFGHNEEITAQKENKGAFLIARELERRGITLGCVFDEGGSVTHIHTGQFEGYAAKIAMAEKGFNDYEIFHDCAGGHSSRPGQGSALGAVARGIVMLEENPFPYRLTPLTKMQLSAMSSYMEEPGKTVFADPLHHEKELIEMARQDPELDALLHTTMAVTMASGSQQSNVMPSHASATVNCRLLQGDTSESVLDYIRSHIPNNLGVRHISGSSPEAIRDIDPAGPIRTASDTLKELYGPDTLIIPSLMAGGTDSRFYAPICSSVFRFGSLLRDDRWGKAHEVDEKIPCDALPTGVSFFRAFLKKYSRGSQD